MQLYKRELQDEDSYLLATIYSWSMFVEILSTTSSKGLHLIPQLLVNIDNTYENAKSLITPFVIGAFS